MPVINYTIDPGTGPNLDRLADSWRYYHEKGTSVLVSFSATRIALDGSGGAHRITEQIVGEVHYLSAIAEDAIIVRLCPYEDGRRMDSRLHEVEVKCNPKRRTGKLIWVVRG